jgi:hypothetical protein
VTGKGRKAGLGVFVFVCAAKRLGYTYTQVGDFLNLSMSGAQHYFKTRPQTAEFRDHVRAAVTAALTATDLDLTHYSTAALLRELLSREGSKG